MKGSVASDVWAVLFQIEQRVAERTDAPHWTELQADLDDENDLIDAAAAAVASILNNRRLAGTQPQGSVPHAPEE